MAEMQGCHALKQFEQKEVYNFREFHTPGVLISGSVMCCEKQIVG